MNRIKIPRCCRCKSNYHIFGDLYGQKMPMLLNCGHDMCKSCLKTLFKRNKQVICEICQVDTMITCEDDMLNVPIHFYLVGKVFILSSNKQKPDIFRDINNLKMRNVNTDPLFNNKKYCDLCYKYAKFGCHQCNEVYCENCSEKIHMANLMMSDHELETLHIMQPNYPVESNCDQHYKLKDFICVTCDLLTCAVCAIDDHREHDIQHLKKYNMSKVQCLNEYTLKGDMLLKKLKHNRNNFREHMQQYQIAHLQKKNSNYDFKKRDVSMFISSIIGALQSLEYKFIHMLDEADQVYNNSMNKVINQLNNLIEDLLEKLNQIDSMSKNSQYSCINMSSQAISDIEHILDMTYYIAKKKRIDTPIAFNQNIFEAINQCIISEIDISDTYILTNSPELPLNYTLTSTIQLMNDALPERRLSSVSSVDSTNSSSVSALSTDVDIPSKFSNLSIRVIMHNVKEYVIITHQNSPSDFYVQLLANNKIIEIIANEIDKFIHTAQSIVKVIEMDNVIYAIQARNGRWYRGHVVNMVNNEDGNHYLYTVYCIDYGFTEILTAERIKRIPECVASIPPLAYNCALYDLKPSIISGWSNNAYQLFTELILNTTGTFYIYPMDTNSEPIQVDVVWKESMYPLSIRDAMFFMGHGSSAEKFINKELHDELRNLISLPSNIQLKEGKEYPVFVNHLITPHEFYMRIMNDEYINLLAETMNALESIYKPTEINSHKSYLLYTPQIGMAVAARYSIDSNWYRAKITSLPEPCMVTVDYIDFGNSETLPWNQLRVLQKNLTKQPALAIRASLIDIEPAVDGVECDKWSSKACSEFTKLLMTTYINENLTAFVQKLDSNSHKVVLYSRTPRGEVCINSHLLSLGHATSSDPSKCIFNKRNKRGTVINDFPINSRDKKDVCTSEDTLSFLKQRSGEKIYHSWIFNDKQKIPRVPMTVINVVSPDHITLKCSDYNFAELNEKMNKAYANIQKNLQKSVWKENDLCAVFINKFGNWYRGKIIKIDTTKTSTIYLYDLDETYDQIPLEQLYVLLSNFVTEKCGILHCGMYNVVPLGVSDGNWSKFSCDRLIEEIARYNNTVYLKNSCKQDDKLYGELWVKDVNTPQALESLNECWINLNRFMIEQGYALDYEKYQKDDECTTTESEQESNENLEIVEHNPSVKSWLAPFPINTPKFNAMVSYVDYHGLIYFHCTDDGTPKLLQKVVKEVNYIFQNSKPEPLNFKWRLGQMVIIKYHLDELWYRGIIINIKENGIFSVQFTDYGNIEDVSHENLRSTLSPLLSNVTDIPQLCVKGFLNRILPVTKNQKWSTSTLDFLHSLVVEKHCVMTVDLEKSNNNIYSIEYLVTNCGFDLCQYMVDKNQAYFSYVDKSKLEFYDYFDDTTINSDEDCSNSTRSCYSNDIDHDLTNYRVQNVKQDKNVNKYKSNSSGIHDIDITNEEVGFLKFTLESHNEFEAQFCTSIGPTRMTFLITKVGGVSMLEYKEIMHKLMFKKCANLPGLTQFTPGTAVVVLMPHPCLAWRRGLIVDGGDYIFLVDMGKSIRLIKENVKLCPEEFLKIPMLSIDCHLANVQISENADSENVMKTMSELLFGLHLKIVGVDNLDDDVVGVELYSHNGKIAYQPLIDNKLLIPKN